MLAAMLTKQASFARVTPSNVLSHIAVISPKTAYGSELPTRFLAKSPGVLRTLEGWIFARMFRVLHTVQSFVVKVLGVADCLSSNFYILSDAFGFVNQFFHFFEVFCRKCNDRFL